MMKKLGIIICCLCLCFTLMACGTTPENLKKDSITEETFQEDMKGTWRSVDGKCIINFYENDEGVYRVSVEQKDSFFDESEKIADYDFSSVTLLNKGKYKYLVELSTSMEGMSFQFELSTNGRKLMTSLNSDVVFYKTFF